jgi:hypothetical protein
MWGMPVKKIKTLVLAMSTASLTGVVMPAHAATDAEVDALRKEVGELKQLVQQLSNQQKTAIPVNTPVVSPATTVANPLLLKANQAGCKCLMDKLKLSFMEMCV